MAGTSQRNQARKHQSADAAVIEASSAAVLRLLPFLNRDQLPFFERRGWIKTRGGRRSALGYSIDELRRLSLINTCYGKGLDADELGRIIEDPTRLVGAEFLHYADMVSAVLTAVQIDDASALAETITSHGCRVMHCEACLLFLEPESHPGYLRLAAASTFDATLHGNINGKVDRRTYERWLEAGMPVGSETPQHSKMPLLRLAVREPKNLFSDETKALPTPAHLASSRYFSWLAAPLIDRKDRVFGYFVFENRLGVDDKPNPVLSFHRNDEEVARRIAALAVRTTEIVPLTLASERLVPSMESHLPLDRFLKRVLRIALLTVRGHRGYAVLRDPETGEPKLVAQRGKRPSLPPSQAKLPPTEPPHCGKLSIGKTIPGRSITAWVVSTGRPHVAPDVRRDPFYLRVSPFTKSQITVPIKLFSEEEAIGALSIESTALNGFDTKDLRTLELLGHQAALYAHILEYRDAIVRAMPAFISEHKPQLKHPLDRLLENIKMDLRFTSGIVYVANHREARLVAQHQIGTPPQAHTGFSYAFNEPALATKVFHQRRPYFSNDPTQDFYLNERGLRFYEIRGPILGVPLTFGSVVVGVLVVWSNEQPCPTEADATLVERYARFAIAPTSHSQHWFTSEDLLEKVGEIRAAIRCCQPYNKTLFMILEALTIVDFDRVRVLQRLTPVGSGAPIRYKCIGSFGTDPPNEFIGQTLDVDRDRWARMIDASDPLASRARLLRAKSPDEYDLNAQIFKRSVEMEWCITDLFVKGARWGYIAADNKQTKRPILPRNLYSMEMFASFAEQAISNCPHQ